MAQRRPNLSQLLGSLFALVVGLVTITSGLVVAGYLMSLVDKPINQRSLAGKWRPPIECVYVRGNQVCGEKY